MNIVTTSQFHIFIFKTIKQKSKKFYFDRLHISWMSPSYRHTASVLPTDHFIGCPPGANVYSMVKAVMTLMMPLPAGLGLAVTSEDSPAIVIYWGGYGELWRLEAAAKLNLLLWLEEVTPVIHLINWKGRWFSSGEHLRAAGGSCNRGTGLRRGLYVAILIWYQSIGASLCYPQNGQFQPIFNEGVLYL